MFYESGTSSHSQAAGFCLSLRDTCKGKQAAKRKSDPKLGLQSVKEPQRRRAFFFVVVVSLAFF